MLASCHHENVEFKSILWNLLMAFRDPTCGQVGDIRVCGEWFGVLAFDILPHKYRTYSGYRDAKFTYTR